MWKEQKKIFSDVFYVLFCFCFICWKDGITNVSDGGCCRKAGWDSGVLDIAVDTLSKNWKFGIGNLGIRLRLKSECCSHNNIGAISSHTFGKKGGDLQN